MYYVVERVCRALITTNLTSKQRGKPKMEQESNTFQQMEEQQGNVQQQPVGNVNGQPINAGGELNINDLSDVAVGDRVKYVREDLDGTEQVIEKFQIFLPDTTQAPQSSQDGKTHYWKINMLATYASQNEDGVNHREYISGARVFKQNDGSASEPSFWYEGSETQSAELWEAVATALDLEPKNLSPRQFMAFLNNKPKVTIVGKSYKNFGNNAGGKVKKNMPFNFQK